MIKLWKKEGVLARIEPERDRPHQKGSGGRGRWRPSLCRRTMLDRGVMLWPSRTWISQHREGSAENHTEDPPFSDSSVALTHSHTLSLWFPYCHRMRLIGGSRPNRVQYLLFPPNLVGPLVPAISPSLFFYQ